MRDNDHRLLSGQNHSLAVTVSYPNSIEEQSFKSAISKLLVFITRCAKLLEFDWFRGMQLVRNCTGEIRAKTCNRDLIGCV